MEGSRNETPSSDAIRLDSKSLDLLRQHFSNQRSFRPYFGFMAVASESLVESVNSSGTQGWTSRLPSDL